MNTLKMVCDEMPHSMRYSGVTPHPNRSRTSDFASSSSVGVRFVLLSLLIVLSLYGVLIVDDAVPSLVFRVRDEDRDAWKM